MNSDLHLASIWWFDGLTLFKRRTLSHNIHTNIHVMCSVENILQNQISSFTFPLSLCIVHEIIFGKLFPFYSYEHKNCDLCRQKKI